MDIVQGFGLSKAQTLCLSMPRRFSLSVQVMHKLMRWTINSLQITRAHIHAGLLIGVSSLVPKRLSSKHQESFSSRMFYKFWTTLSTLRNGDSSTLGVSASSKDEEEMRQGPTPDLALLTVSSWQREGQSFLSPRHAC